MAEIRVWHSSRDPYHCAFRFLRLIEADGRKDQELERLRVLDMFLLYPGLLHRASMTTEVRAKFRSLRIPKIEAGFVRVPSSAAVFQDLRLYQNSAASQLAARAVIDPVSLAVGLVRIVAENLPMVLKARIESANADDAGLTKFLVQDLSAIPTRGPTGIYRKSGLPSRSLIA